MWLLLLAWVRTFVFVMWKNGTEPWRKWADVTYISMWRHISILTYFRYTFARTHTHMHAHARQQWDGQGEGYLHYLHCVLCLPLTVSGADQMVVIHTRRHTHTRAPAHTHGWWTFMNDHVSNPVASNFHLGDCVTWSLQDETDVLQEGRL